MDTGNSAMSPQLKLRFVGPLAIALAFGAIAHASNNPAMDTDVHHIDNEWARIKYQVKDKDEQLKEIDALSKEAATVVDHYPGRAEPLLWDGIVTSEEAGMASVFHQLGLAIAAKKMFEQAEAIDPKVLNGAVTMSLGVIYYRVPGFPIGFGNDSTARDYLEAAMAMDPGGLDANYFYGDFLVHRGEYDHARDVLVHALEAPVNPDRPVWDAGRRADIQVLLATIDKRAGR
jgi:hypothetical protein